MRVHDITCPKCRAGLKSKAGVPVGNTLNCPKCRKPFTVEAPAEDPDVVDDFVEDTDVIETEDVRPPKRVPPPPPKKKARDDDDETEEIPTRKLKKKVERDDDEEDDDPRPTKKEKKKKREYDDEDEGVYAKLKGNIAVRIITMVILLAILAVCGYLLYEKKMKEREDAQQGGTVIPTLALDAIPPIV